MRSGTERDRQGRHQLDRPQPGDIYVLCSDGLCGPASDEEIHEIVLAEQKDLKLGASKLIECANDNGGPDNITVVLTKVIGNA